MDDASGVNQGGGPDGAQDRPLVTFALFAYNQEKYIREAVEGAFAQTYQPLEIILSDDCSTDRTFEIMQEMAAVYRGPHTVRLNRSPRNLGIGAHVSSVFAISSGELVIVAAGDDISSEDRTSIIVHQASTASNAYAFCSPVYIIETNQILTVRPPETVDELFDRMRWLLGAAAAYRNSLFSKFGGFDPELHHEDEALALRALILGKIHFIPSHPLVHFRSTSGVSSPQRRNYDPSLFQMHSRSFFYKYNILARQWRRDLVFANKIYLFERAKRWRVRNTFLLTLSYGRKIPRKLFWLHMKEFGLKSNIYFIIGYKSPNIMNSYLKIRHKKIKKFWLRLKNLLKGLFHHSR